MNLETILSAFAVAGVGFSGWNFYLQSKLAQIGKIWGEVDGLKEAIANTKLEFVKDFVTKQDMKDSISKIDADIEELGEKLDKIYSKLMEGSK